MANGIPQLMTPPASSAFRSALTLAQGALYDYLSTDVKWGIYYSGSSQQVILGTSKPSSISGVLGQATSISGIKSLLNGQLIENNVYIDSVISMSQQKGSELSDYRIEKGSFITFNKVEKPREIRLTLTKSGTEEERALFLVWLEKRAKGISNEITVYPKRSAGKATFSGSTISLTIDTINTPRFHANNMFDIYMPEVHYSNMTLVDYSISRDSDNGAYIIIADCVFREVREVAPIYQSSKMCYRPSDQSSSETTSVETNEPSPNAISKLKGIASKVGSTISGLF